MTVAHFRAALLAPDMAPPPGLTDGAGRPAGRRFDVYRNNVAVGLAEALETGFPVLRKLLGPETFRQFAGLALRAHPPRSPLMMEYGQDLPDFLAGFAPLAHLPYLADVARLELALRRAYHAEDATPVAPETLAALPPERLMAARLRLAPAVQVIRSPWPIHAIWALNMAGGPKPVAGAQDVMIGRPDLDPAPWLLPPGGADAIAALRSGARVETALQGGGETDLAGLFTCLLAAGAIVHVSEEECP
ncbi:DNA-binding domain-containing protein [Mesobacterium pallidum]|uniref:HvfC/BufC N-terminal domain-containing protein n=1 Tax=Mesobacterium pallidum TaxID=2872037 RepID=UPI001EE38D5C|nr:DNA-binding domain-containing protein [Mesobacterium pallidum]